MSRRLDLSCHGCRSFARTADAHTCGQGAPAGVMWGWMNANAPEGTREAGSVTWVGGSLEDSYARVSAHGGAWILATSEPVEAYRGVMLETAKAVAS